MHPEILPEMQPAFEFPAHGSEVNDSSTSGSHHGDFLTHTDWPLAITIFLNVLLVSFKGPAKQVLTFLVVNQGVCSYTELHTMISLNVWNNLSLVLRNDDF